MQISYRKLVAIDSRQYREIRLESLKLHPESFGSSFAEQSRLPKLMFERALEQPVDGRFVIGAFDRESLIGICGFVPFVLDSKDDLDNTGTIIQMYVKSAYRGRKIGLGLVKAALHEAFKIPGIEQVVLSVKKGNISAIRVYEQAGFEIVNPDGHEPEVNMVRAGNFASTITDDREKIDVIAKGAKGAKRAKRAKGTDANFS